MAINAPSTDSKDGGKPVTTLAGWSAGRLGPLYYLARASSAQEMRINYILLIDPGSYSELSSSCDSHIGAGNLLANWLLQSSSHHLVVLAGDVTADTNHPISGYAHAGIQNVYFNAIRSLAARSAANARIRAQVLVCNYSMPGINVNNQASIGKSHDQMFFGGNKYTEQAALASCPAVSGMNSGVSWHP